MSVASEFASEEDFLAIEAAVMETARGRRFLAEFARRGRVAETQALLTSIQRIESAVTLKPLESGESALLAAAIHSTCADIAAIRNHMLENGGAIPDGAGVFEAIAAENRSLANDIVAASENKTGAELSTLGWRLDVLSQRVTKAMALLAHIESRVEASAARPETAAPEPELAGKLVPENLKFFAEDEELFVEPPMPMPPPPAPVKSEKLEEIVRDRVVIIRRTANPPPPMPTLVSDNVA